MDAFEKKALKKGFQYIAGCDEAGRGPLAGPLVVACVRLNPDSSIEGLNDSKKLSEKKREMLYELIVKHAEEYSVKIYDAKKVDELNVYQASKQGMIEAASYLKNVDYLLTDAMPITHPEWEVESIIKGDQKSVSIAAASILAKVTRDRLMVELGSKYEGYGFETHKGYPTKKHLEAIKQKGILPVHRKTFKPIKNLIEVQQSLEF